MAEHLRGELEVAGGPIGEAGGQVPEVVQAHRRQAGADHQPVEALRGAVGHQSGAVGLGEDQAGVDPCRAQLEAQRHLPAAVGTKHLDGAGVQAHRPRAGVGLRVALDDVAGHLDAGLADRDGAPVEVDIGPGQPERLGAAQAAERDEVPERVQLVLGDRVEERAGLLRRHALPHSSGLHWFGDLVLTSHSEKVATVELTAPAARIEDFRPTVLMAKVADALEQHGPLSQRRLSTAVRGNRQTAIDALNYLVLDGYVTEATPHELIKPYPPEETAA